MQKLYVLLRKDLPLAYGAVQAGHAVAEYLLNHQTTWDNGTMVYLGVQGEPELKKWHEKLQNRGIPSAMFREPDIGDQATALACVDEGRVFASLPLLKN